MDGVLGTQTQGGRIEGADESTELYSFTYSVLCQYLVCVATPKDGLNRNLKKQAILGPYHKRKS